MTAINQIPDLPKYTIKHVSVQTGIHPVTLRAWERRYRVLTPRRSNNRYRLYSDRDIAVLSWLRSRVDDGVGISAAAVELRKMVENGIWPDVVPIGLPIKKSKPSRSPSDYAIALYQLLIARDEAKASSLFREILVGFNIKTIVVEILTPCLVEIGEAWYRGEIRITTEHFASAFLRGKLMALLQAYPSHRKAPYIMVGGAPTEEHEIGPLMIAVLLRNEGYRVEFLGANLPLDDLLAYAQSEKPAMIILSATTRPAALALCGFQEKVDRLRSAPVFGYGGRAFVQEPSLRQQVPGTFLGETMDLALQTIIKILGPSKTNIKK